MNIFHTARSFFYGAVFLFAVQFDTLQIIFPKYQIYEATVFRTTAEISANLVFRGNIKHPMDLRALGRVMSAMGYVSKRLGKTRARGFLVIENQVNSSTALALAQKIRAQEMADKADKGQEVF